MTHRLLLLAGLTPGQSRLRGALTSLDTKSSAGALRALGVSISPLRRGGEIRIGGRHRFQRPETVLNCGNSGTSARLLLGILAAHPFATTLTGDASLRRRPMGRVTGPLSLMGAKFLGRDPDHLPLTVQGGPLRALEWEMPVSSAQIKSSVLFAGLVGGVPVAVREPAGRSRDHTERLFRSFGYEVGDSPDGWIRFRPTGHLEPFDLEVPGDPSSAAFLVGLALLADEGSLRVAGVGLNPTRTGFLRVLERMGAGIRAVPMGDRCGEPVGDLVIEPSRLQATTVTAEEIPGLIDEIPLLAVLASRAAGVTTFHEVGELRVKESDRLGLLAANLRAIGAKASAVGDALVVESAPGPPIGAVRTEGDHRIAMAFAVLGKMKGAEVEIDNLACAEVSFPGFPEALHAATSHPRAR